MQWRLVFHHGVCAILLNLNLTEYKDLRKFLLDIHQFRSITTVSVLPIKNLIVLLRNFVLVSGIPLMVVIDRHVAVIKQRKFVAALDEGRGGETFVFIYYRKFRSILILNHNLATE